MILYLRADILHGGCFKTNKFGSPRCHFYIHKNPGIPFSFGQKNSYNIPLGTKSMSMFLSHCKIAQQLESFVSLPTDEVRVPSYNDFRIIKDADNEDASDTSDGSGDPYGNPYHDKNSDDGEQ